MSDMDVQSYIDPETLPEAIVGRLPEHRGHHKAAIPGGDDTIRCPRCSRVLGVRVGSLICVRHQRREIVAGDVRSIRCEDCRATWTPAAPTETSRLTT